MVIALLITAVLSGVSPVHCHSKVVHVTRRVVVHGRYGDTIHEYSVVKKVCQGSNAIR